MRTFFVTLYQLYKWGIFLPLLVLDTLLVGLLVIIFSLFKADRIMYWLGRTWSRTIGYLTPVRVLVKGKENIEKGRSYIVIADHQSYYDILAMSGWLGLDLKYVMKKELGRVPVFGYACKSYGHIFIDRSNRKKAIESINKAAMRIRPGHCVLFYPEGSRSRTGELQPFRKGAFRLSLNTGMPVLPVSLVGTREIQPPDTWRLMPGTIRMKAHPPIEPDGFQGEEGIKAMMDQAWNTIHSGMEELQEDRRKADQ